MLPVNYDARSTQRELDKLKKEVDRVDALAIGPTGPAGPAGPQGAVGLQGPAGLGSLDVLDEDDMVSNADNKLATQQSIKQYVDSNIASIPTLTSNLSTLTTNLNTSNVNISDLIDFTGFTEDYSGSDLLARLAAEAAARTSAISASSVSLQNQIDDLLAISVYDNSTSYSQDDQVTYNNKLYKAKQSTTGNLPTNTTYWQLLGDYTSLGDTVGDNTSSINAINTVSATSTSAAAQAISALNSTVNSATGVVATSQALDSVETLVNNTSTGVSASASKIGVLESTVNDPTTGVEATSNALDVVETLVTATGTGVTASANKISALESTVNNATTGVEATSNALDVVETLVNDSDDGVAASATKISALESTVNNATTGVEATADAVDVIEVLVNDTDDGVAASATKVSALESTINNPTTGFSAVSSALDVVETLVNDSDDGVAASATKISTLNTTVGNNTASIQTQASTINGLTSQFTVKTDVAGKVAGFGLYNDATTGSEFAIAADRFYLVPSPDLTGPYSPTSSTVGSSGQIYWATITKKYFRSSGASQGGYVWNELATPNPFVVTTTPTTVGGESVPAGVYMDNAYIKNGSVDTLSIAGQAVTVPSTASTSPNTYYEEDDSTWITPVELNVSNSGAKTEIEGQLWFQPAYADGLVSMMSIFTLLDIKLHTKFYNSTTYLGDYIASDNNVCVTHRNSISHVITSLLTPPANTTRIEIDLKFRVQEAGTAWGVNAITAKINALEVKK